MTIFSFFQNKNALSNNRLLLFPTFLFIASSISLFYSDNLNRGLTVLLSQIEFLILPFIFLINQKLIKERFFDYLIIFIAATTIAAAITFLFFLLPGEIVQNIANTFPLLKEYIVHEKAFAFGVYSPFTERLQFSYVIGVAFFLQLWLWFRDIKVGGTLKVPPTFALLILVSTLLILGARGAQISFLVASIIWVVGSYFQFIHPKISQRFNPIFSYGLLTFCLSFFLFIAPYLAYKNIPQ